MSSFALILLQLLVVFDCVKSFFWVDCTYEKDTYHVEYTCQGAVGIRFGHRTEKFLYCNNYMPAIDRHSVRILSFRGCHDSTPPSAVISNYNGLRVYNLSSTGIENLSADWLEYLKFLEIFIASNNELAEIPSDLFRYTPKITAIDFSFNQIRSIDPATFDNIRRLKKIRFDHNLISELHGGLFAALVDLEILDFGNNRIQTIESNLLTNNGKLKSLNFGDNHIKRLDCEFLAKFVNSYSVNISLNTLNELQTNCDNDRIDMEFNVKISSSESTMATICNGQFEWMFNEVDFHKLFHLNFANNRHLNISALLVAANTHLFTLDLSNTFIGELNGRALQRFAYLKELYLSRTNLPNILFGTFHHQINLKILDISYNDFGQFDFYLFLRNFQSLEILSLEGNDLTEIDSLSRAYFPKLSTLIISYNRLSCEYLAKFLRQWNGLRLINNPSMDGLQCSVYHHSTTEYSIVIDQPIIRINDVETSKAHIAWYEDQSQEFFIIKLLLITLAAALSTVCLCATCYKCVRRIKRYPVREIATESVSFRDTEVNRNDFHTHCIDVE